jgi:hypothetical protein
VRGFHVCQSSRRLATVLVASRLPVPLLIIEAENFKSYTKCLLGPRVSHINFDRLRRKRSPCQKCVSLRIKNQAFTSPARFLTCVCSTEATPWATRIGMRAAEISDCILPNLLGKNTKTKFQKQWLGDKFPPKTEKMMYRSRRCTTLYVRTTTATTSILPSGFAFRPFISLSFSCCSLLGSESRTY